MKSPTVKDIIQKLQENHIVEQLVDTVKVSGDFTPTDLIRVEKFINKRFSSAKEIESFSYELAVALGYYLGEVMVHNMENVTWAYDYVPRGDNPWFHDLLVVQAPLFNEGGESSLTSAWYPINRILMFVQDRTNHTIYNWYKMMEYIQKQKYTVRFLMENEWIETPFGKFRTRNPENL